MKTTIVLLLFVCLFAACAEGPAATTSPVPTTIDTNTATVTPRHTGTPPPTKTPTATFPPTMTIPAATLSAVGTKEAIRLALLGQFPELEEYHAFCNSTYCQGMDVSPDGQWAYFANEDGLEIFSITGDRVGKYSFPELSGRLDILEGRLGGVHWSNDGQYLYLATSFGDGGPGAYFGYKYSLARVNLRNGTWKDTGISGVVSFSLDDRYIAYSTNLSEIRVRTLQSGEEKIYLTPAYYQFFGEFVWSPDGKKTIFVSTPGDFDELNEKFALYMIDLESDESTLLDEGFMPFYYPVEWIEDNKVALQKYNATGTWILDLSVTPPTINP